MPWVFLGPACPSLVWVGLEFPPPNFCLVLLWGLSWEVQGLRAQLSPPSVLPTFLNKII